MKSPTSSVGSMEPEGILKGSTTNERNTKTISNTGKNTRAYSTIQLNLPRDSDSYRTEITCLFKSRQIMSMNQIAPVTETARTNTKVKSAGAFNF